MVGLAGLKTLVRQVGAEFSEKNVTFMAAGIAYNAFISLAPLLVLLLIAVSVVGSGLEQRIVEIAGNSLPGPIADVVREVFQGESGSASASVVGLVVLVWGTLKIFRGLDTAFSEIYETTDDNSFVDKMVDGLVVGVAILVAVLATVGVTALFARLEDAVPYIGYLTPLVLVAGLIVAFVPMYYRFPDTDVGLRNVLPGAAFAAVGWAAFQSLFQVYLAFSSGSTGSLFGGVVVVITWLYFSGLVLLLGAVINAVLGGHTSGKAGGVGQGASGYETEREETMNRDEFAEYVHRMHSALAGHYEDLRGSDDAAGVGRYPDPDDDVTVIEQSRDEGDEREWSVAFRWRTDADDTDEGATSADD